MKVEIYSDVVCPWCYIGDRRFARALAAFAGAEQVDVAYRPYQLDPDAPAEPIPVRSYLERRFGGRVDGMLGRVSETARGEGIEVDWDRALSVNTLTAHRLLRLAGREHGPAVQHALLEKLFDAHFTRGGNVADHGLLADLAASAGMDRARVREYLDSGEGLLETREELEHARRIGVRAVPTFVFDDQYVVEGAQPASVFLRVLEEVASRAAGSDAEGGGGAAACDDGACAV
ncbi:MAG TPA: DsbA family oxidoreductase [Longimicrobiales bacterium]